MEFNSYYIEHMKMIEEDTYFYALVLSKPIDGYTYLVAVEKDEGETLNTILLGTDEVFSLESTTTNALRGVVENPEGIEGVMHSLGYTLQKQIH